MSIRRDAALALLSFVALAACDGNSSVLNIVSTPPAPVLAPTLLAIRPSEGALDSTVAVSLAGTLFIAGATTVSAGDTAISVRDVSVAFDGLSLTASFEIRGSATLGAHSVRVTTPNGTSNALTFTVVAGARFVDLGLVIRDTKTNLFWEKKTAAGTGGLHDVATKYSWCAATGNTAPTLCSGNTTSWIADVNVERFAGFRDWRVPSQAELQSILLSPCPGNGALCIDPIFGPTSTTTAAPYWSSTVVDADNAVLVDFADGSVVHVGKLTPNLVRAVRSAP